MWVWINQDVVLAIHDEQLSEHGGAAGRRDLGLLESALARPQHSAAYGQPDLAELASADAVGIARNHPFTDGNKRTALVVAETFLALNGCDLVASDEACVRTMLAVADGSLDVSGLAMWMRDHLIESEAD